MHVFISLKITKRAFCESNKYFISNYSSVFGVKGTRSQLTKKSDVYF